MSRKRVMVDQKFVKYVDENLNSFAKDVMRLVSQPSVSARHEGVDQCALLVEQMLKEVGAETRVIRAEGFAPLVYGEIRSDRSGKTILFYNHYDVQPEEPLELWKSPAFKPEIREGRIYGRGSSDDKGELASRLDLVKAYQKTMSDVPCNFKFCFEGEEETGSPHLYQYIQENKELFRSDAVFWEGGEVDAEGRPSVALGMKGMIYAEFSLKMLEMDAHSSFAAVLPSAAWKMVRMLSTLKDENERVLVPGWYDNVETLSEEDQAVLEEQEFDAESFLQVHGSKGFVNSLTPSQAKKALVQRPTANIAGIWAGYQGPGSKTVLPKEIHCKADFRLVPNQDPEDLLRKLRNHLDGNGFSDIVIETETLEPAARTTYKDPFVQAAVSAGEKVWKKKPTIKLSEAGTGPFYVFTKTYAEPAIAIGVSASDAGMHSPNENLRLDYLRNGILWFAETIENYLR
ncbi:MAG TPA: M20/M25/M40 family metallo-hydrolase [Nitrososphaerales archaeon]|nr:M20/M25/M40 family metallo-hydrolase [Nitrososphaerales archaeon]